MVDGRVRRIAFVTRHYSETRGGVMRAVLAPFLIGLGLLGDPIGSSLPLMPVYGAGVFYLSVLTGRWMDRRFGRVVSGVTHQRVVAIVCLVAFFVTMRLDSHGIGTGRPSMLFLGTAVYGLWLCVRLWPYGLHNLLPVIVAAGGAVAFSGVSNHDEFVAWERHAYVYTLLAWTAAGLIDFALLLKMLPDCRAEEVNADAS